MTNPRIEDLRRRLEREPGSRLFAQLAEELRKDGDLLEAIRVARDGLQKHPAYPSARMTLGRALLDKGDLAGARAEFESVLKGAPDNILASRFLAECLEGLGDLAAAAGRYKSTLLLSPGDRQVQARLEAVEQQLGKRSGGGGILAAGQEPRPIPVVEVDGPMELEAPYEGRAVETGLGSGLDRPAAASIPTAFVEESFEVERSAEPPALSPWRSDVYVPDREVVFEVPEDDTATIPPGLAHAPLVDSEPVEVVEPLVEPEPALVAAEPAPEPQPPLASPTLAELYLNQGFTDKALEVYRQLLEREPANERVRARLGEIEALDRHLRAEELRDAPAAPAPTTASQGTPEADPGSRRREAVERTIARLEGFLAAVRKG